MFGRIWGLILVVVGMLVACAHPARAEARPLRKAGHGVVVAWRALASTPVAHAVSHAAVAFHNRDVAPLRTAVLAGARRVKEGVEPRHDRRVDRRADGRGLAALPRPFKRCSRC